MHKSSKHTMRKKVSKQERGERQREEVRKKKQHKQKNNPKNKKKRTQGKGILIQTIISSHGHVMRDIALLSSTSFYHRRLSGQVSPTFAHLFSVLKEGPVLVKVQSTKLSQGCHLLVRQMRTRSLVQNKRHLF